MTLEAYKFEVLMMFNLFFILLLVAHILRNITKMQL